MRASLVRAIELGVIVPLGSHRVVLGGAIVDADVYRADGKIHLEIDCNKQTLETILGAVKVDGAMHLEMDESVFERARAAAQNASPRLLAAARFLTGDRPLLER